MSVWIQRKHSKKVDVEELIHNLTSGKKEERKNAAIQLDKNSWTPRTELEKANYFFANQQWDKLVDLGSSALEPILSGLMDEDKSIQKSCIRHLSELGNPKSIEILRQKLDSSHPQIRTTAAIALRNLGWYPITDEEKISFLIAQQQWDDLPQFGEKIIGPLSALLDDNDEEIRIKTTESLCKLRDIKVLGILKNALKDKSKKVRITAVQGLVNLKNPDTVDTLIIALNDADSAIQRTARNGLIQLDSDAVEKLIDTLKKNETD